MWTFLSMALSYLIGSPLVQAVALNVITDLVTHGKELVPIALEKIKEVAPNKDMTGTEKFAKVADSVSAEFPTIAKSALDTIIQSTYNAYANPNVKEVV